MKNRQSKRGNTFRAPILPDDLTSQLKERILALPASVKADYLKEEVFSKFVSKDTDPPLVRRNRAIFKLLCAEQDNAATEDRLLMTREDFNILPRVPYSRFVEWCGSLVESIIGDTPPLDALIGAFSGGASTSRPRTRSHPASKYYGTAHVTDDCLQRFVDVVDEMPGWLNARTSNDLTIQGVLGNVLFTVPKKTDIDRCAAKEPDLNMFIQKGVGNYFRSCLRRTGINLNDQSINRSLARVGSIDGSLCTLDLSSASDSITRELVFQLLPVTWFTLLDSVRSRVTIIDGEEHRNHMFSNMGNGFTFELESLLFYVLMRGVAFFTGTRGVVSVYGDDLILPSEMAQQAIYVLGYFGFQVNPDKSHVSGPLRESCGGHYYNGFDITPFYVKGPIETVPDLIDVANKLRKWGSPSDLTIAYPVIDPDVEEIWLWLKSLVPSILWGGKDLSFKYQLVSHDTPVKRLHEVSKRKKAGAGGYPLWLNATWARTINEDDFDPYGLETSTLSKSQHQLELKGVRDTTVTRPEAWFLHELT